MLKRIHIRNFKSLGDVVVDLGQVTVLIGRSGTGKTNFVEALRFLRDALLDRNIVATQQRYGGWEKLYCATGSKPAFSLVRPHIRGARHCGRLPLSAPL